MQPRSATTPALLSSERTLRFQTLTYRRRLGGDVWHYHPHCSRWPAERYAEQRTTPSGYRFCTECDGHVAADYVQPPPSSQPLRPTAP